ncbi:uncharacterized protein UTRI_02271 [Ustilago trichophora]|uniref:Uncharacterized protein n=1 Tax=Ustilago trichophora TaxID=86804 RepID=A0A5C3E8P7_9BASI|nr:uncharacterized protein UTRI_02271 [Ustilago trichophora]
MARTHHFPVQANIPIYSVDFVQDDLIVYSGGGGVGRSGVTNAVVAARVDLSAQAIHKLDELKLSRDEDAPMAMAVNVAKSQIVCGINNAADGVKKGINQPIRIFDYSLQQFTAGSKQTPADDKGKAKEQSTQHDINVELHFAKAVSSLHLQNPEEYIKVATFSPNGRMLAVASTDGQIALHRYPSLSSIWNDAGEPSSSALAAAEAKDTSISIPSQDFEKSEIYDADFSHSNTHVVFTSSSKLIVYATDPSPNQMRMTQRPMVTQLATLRKDSHKQSRRSKIPLSVAKALALSERLASAVIRKSFVTAWDADTWDLIETRHVSDRPVTVFDVSPDGNFLAYGSSDLSIGVLDAKTLRPVLKILHAHDFPPTCLKFNPASNLLISASADNTLRVIPIPAKALLESASSGGALAFISETRMGFYTTIFLSLLIAAVALWVQRNYLIK